MAAPSHLVGHRYRTSLTVLELTTGDPFEAFEEWFADATARAQPEPEAMALATSTPGGHSSVRFVLMRGFDRRGFVFYTNRRSRKGEEMGSNPWASLAFRWYAVDRQVRAAGPVVQVGEDESDAYFAGRPRGSQLGAWASNQSRALADRAELERALLEVERRFEGGSVPRPPWWGGYRVVPEEMEFWQQGASRLHDRFVYRRRPGGPWEMERLAP